MSPESKSLLTVCALVFLGSGLVGFCFYAALPFVRKIQGVSNYGKEVLFWGGIACALLLLVLRTTFWILQTGPTISKVVAIFLCIVIGGGIGAGFGFRLIARK